MRMKNKLQIKSVRIERVTDSDGDSSYLGEFTNETSPGAIIREGKYVGSFLSDLPADFEFPRGGREYHYFLPAMTGEETGNPDSPKQDWRRMEALNNGDWCYIGVIAKAEVWNPASQVCQTVRSGGLWGVESDSGDYLNEVAKEELAGLKSELEAIGLGERAIARAFRDVETVNK